MLSTYTGVVLITVDLEHRKRVISTITSEFRGFKAGHGIQYHSMIAYPWTSIAALPTLNDVAGRNI